MELGIILPVSIILFWLYFVVSEIISARKSAQVRDKEDPARYRNYDIQYLPSANSGFIPYDSYEFAGVRGSKRTLLEESRSQMLAQLSAVPQHGIFFGFLVLSKQQIDDNKIYEFPEMRMTPLAGAIVTLTDCRRFLVTVEIHRITSVEGSPHGVPFGVEDIKSIVHTPHFVTLKLMESRWKALRDAGIDLSELGDLSPGNYYPTRV